MNFKEFLAKLGSAATKHLTDAKALIAEATTVLAAAVAEIEAKANALTVAEQSLVDVRAELATANASLTTAQASITELTEKVASTEKGVLAVLADAGIKVEKLEPAALKAAAKARAEAIGHELLAARGTKPLPEQVKPADELAESDPKTDAAIVAKYESMPAGAERVAFLEKHKAAIWRAFTGK